MAERLHWQAPAHAPTPKTFGHSVVFWAVQGSTRRCQICKCPAWIYARVRFGYYSEHFNRDIYTTRDLCRPHYWAHCWTHKTNIEHPRAGGNNAN